MMLTGTGVGADGIWKVSMLTERVQKIIEKWPTYFDGKSPYHEEEDGDEEKDSEMPTGPPKKKRKPVFLIYFGGALQMMTPREYLKNLGSLRSTDKEKKEYSKLIKSVIQKFDNESVSHRALIKFLRGAMPRPIPLGSVFPTQAARVLLCLNA
jgi:hypothetical protein